MQTVFPKTIYFVGDSIPDNQSGVKPDGLPIETLVHSLVNPASSIVRLHSDGDIISGVLQQLHRIPCENSGCRELNECRDCIVVSAGRNNLRRTTFDSDGNRRITDNADQIVARLLSRFEQEFRILVDCISDFQYYGYQIFLCTICKERHKDAEMQRLADYALPFFNRVIEKIAAENDLSVIEINDVCIGSSDCPPPMGEKKHMSQYLLS